MVDTNQSNSYNNNTFEIVYALHTHTLKASKYETLSPKNYH